MDWIPNNTDSVVELPPPVPPKMNKIALFDASQNGVALDLRQSNDAMVFIEQDNDNAPALPPKPKYVVHACSQ